MSASTFEVRAAEDARYAHEAEQCHGCWLCRCGDVLPDSSAVVWHQAQAVADAVVTAVRPRFLAGVTRDLADLLLPSSGIGLANGASRADVAQWLRNRADQIEGNR